MTLGDVWRAALRSLLAHRLRFALTALGIVWGVAMLTFLLAAVDGYETNFGAQLDEIAQRAIFFFPGTVSRATVGQREARPVELELKDLHRLDQLSGVERAAAHVPLGPRLVRAAGRSKLVWIYGVSAETLDIRSFRARTGRRFASGDVAAHARVVFLGARAARRLFGAAPAAGKSLHIDGIPFVVVGASQPKDEQIIYLGPADDEIAMIPITTAQRRFLHDDVVSQIVVEPRTRDGSWDTTQAARALLGFHHTFAADDHGAMGAFNLEEIRQLVAPLYLGLRIFLMTASLITLAVGAVGVMNIMLVVVTERTKEIGLRKAVGGSNGAIFAQFLAETVMVCVVAGAVGAAFGALAVAALAHVIGEGSVVNAPPLLLPSRVLLVMTTLIAIGIAAGLLPAARAARVDPAVSLRAT